MELDLPPSSAIESRALSSGTVGGDPFRILNSAVQETFLVERVVAHGGFGVVYRAKHLKFAAPVALKCLKIPATLTEEERNAFLERFSKEGEVMFRLSGTIPEVVRPLQFDSFRLADGRLVPFIAFEWLDGETLKDVIVRRLTEGQPPLGLHAAVDVLSSVARALHRAHRVSSPEGELCILHCDLKPDNIFVCASDGGQVIKIFDFGIAKVRSAATREAGRATAETQGNMFTPAYAAPEQWAPDKYGQAGPWTDVFSLALTLAELATQRPAIDGPPSAMLALCLDENKRPTPRRLGLDTSDAVDAVFRKALAVAPTQRYRSMEAFWNDLERALGVPQTMPNLRRSVAGIPAVLPDVLGRNGHGAELRFDAPLAGGARSAPSAPGMPEFSGDLDFGLETPPPSVARPVSAAPVVVAPPTSSTDAMFSPGGGSSSSMPAGLDPDAFGTGALDLDVAPSVHPSRPVASHPSHPAGHHGSAPPNGVYPSGPPSHASQRAPQSLPHSMPGSAPPISDMGMPAPPASARAAEVAALAARNASVAAQRAAGAARHLAGKALEVDHSHEIRFDEPSTWLKPMLPPIIIMAVALLSTVVVVIVNRSAGTTIGVTWFALPLMLVSIAFGVYRWMKLTRG